MAFSQVYGTTGPLPEDTVQVFDGAVIIFNLPGVTRLSPAEARGLAEELTEAALELERSIGVAKQ